MIPDYFSIAGLGSIRTYQSEFAGQIVHWMGEDNEQSFRRKMQDPDQRQKLAEYGWLEKEITYRFNSQGFRSPDFHADRPHFCVFGDSVSFGAALPQDSLYHEILSRTIGITCYNFSISGASDHSAVRLAITWLPILHPHFVIWQRTFDHRYEVIEQDQVAVTYGVQAFGGGDVPKTSDSYYRAWMAYDENRQLSTIKNISTMRYLCDCLSIPLVEVSIDDFFQPNMDRGRDLLHPGPMCHANIAKRLMETVPTKMI